MSAAARADPLAQFTPKQLAAARYRARERALAHTSVRPCPCWYCDAKDSRQPDHARGCPTLPAVTQDELLELARRAENGWSSREIARIEWAKTRR